MSTARPTRFHPRRDHVEASTLRQILYQPVQRWKRGWTTAGEDKVDSLGHPILIRKWAKTDTEPEVFDDEEEEEEEVASEPHQTVQNLADSLLSPQSTPGPASGTDTPIERSGTDMDTTPGARGVDGEDPTPLPRALDLSAGEITSGDQSGVTIEESGDILSQTLSSPVQQPSTVSIKTLLNSESGETVKEVETTLPGPVEGVETVIPGPVDESTILTEDGIQNPVEETITLEETVTLKEDIISAPSLPTEETAAAPLPLADTPSSAPSEGIASPERVLGESGNRESIETD